MSADRGRIREKRDIDRKEVGFMLELKGRIVLPDRILEYGRVLCDGGRILEITELPRESEAPEVNILPGLIDIHNHGAMCHDYMEASEEAFGKIAGHLTAHGITTAQCTTVSAPVEQLHTGKA